MPKATAAAPYQPVALSDLTSENVAQHINSAIQFLDKFMKSGQKRREALGGNGEHILNFAVVQL